MNQKGFSLFELMIAMSILAMLTVISVPTYQSYIQKAALTTLLQYLIPYKNGVELCLLTQDSQSCSNGVQDIPAMQANRYAEYIQVKQGVIRIKGIDTLTNLQIETIPNINSEQQQIIWNTRCQSQQSKLQQLCETIFKL